METLDLLLKQICKTYPPDFDLMLIAVDLMEELGDWRYRWFRWAGENKRFPDVTTYDIRQFWSSPRYLYDVLPEEIFQRLPLGSRESNQKFWMSKDNNVLGALEVLCKAYDQTTTKNE